MVTVTVSQQYQVVIPKAVREALRIQPGQKLQIVPYENRIELFPIRPMQEARGFLKGMDTSVERKDDWA